MDQDSKEKIGTLTKDEFVSFYKKYVKIKKTNNQIDFADLLELCIAMLKDNPQITKLFLASEDMDYISAMHAAFPQSYFMPDVFRKTDAC